MLVDTFRSLYDRLSLEVLTPPHTQTLQGRLLQENFRYFHEFDLVIDLSRPVLLASHEIVYGYFPASLAQQQMRQEQLLPHVFHVAILIFSIIEEFLYN